MHILNIIEAISLITLLSYHLNYLYNKKIYLITIRLFLFELFELKLFKSSHQKKTLDAFLKI